MTDELPEGFSYVPEGSGWFSQSSQIESIELHGITWEQYHDMLNKQQGFCAICGRHYTSVGQLHVDHDHSSKKVRGLLCRPHNIALGLFRDDPHLLQEASRYLIERGCWATDPKAAHPEVAHEAKASRLE